jgi:hypothetical protein
MTATTRHEDLVERVLRLYRPEVIREAARRLETRRRRDAGTVAVTDRDVAACGSSASSTACETTRCGCCWPGCRRHPTG